MKNRKNIEKLGIAALAVLCLFLIVKVISEITGNPADGVQPVTVSAQTPKALQTDPVRTSAAPSQSASPAQMRSLDQYRPKPLPDLSRNPFNFGQAPLSPAQKAMQAARAAAGGAMTATTAAGPPPIPLRAIGYSERAVGGPEAYLMDNNDVYVVHDGDVLSKRFRILKITSTAVEVQDGASGEKAQLPIPVVQ